MLSFSYLFIKWKEMADPRTISDEEKRNSGYLRNQKERGIYNPLFPGYTATKD